MNMFARFDENPAMTLQDIMETKHYRRTHGRTDNVKKYTHHKQGGGGGGGGIIILFGKIVKEYHVSVRQFVSCYGLKLFCKG